MHPNLVAPHLPEFAQAWCQALYEIRDNEEKDSAFRGFCTLVQTNPAGIAKVCFRRCVVLCLLTDIHLVAVVVLQRNCQMDTAIARVEPHVPAAFARFQGSRRDRVGRPGVPIPARYSRTSRCPLWRVIPWQTSNPVV